ncbi:uncharacterized protein THITE_2077924 [Thermothielavioides terrestris NRRL 8126]|uniref:Uncharacterized protein n=2 Tax=Thermothielavioides terrestris TaxID=2587410 RepID=G2QZQ0_THETT|nr:uncharacterized protein THITE_2077924 [Thermothielavioides terrestris NRRL 8126]AEO66379.1 hypothetical protein THITE_2077924 [Thermothielavioides terrestris NRRL 8126]
MIVAHSGFFVPEDTSCELPEPSDPSSRLSDDIEAAESHIFESDLQFWEDAAEEDGSPERYDDIDVPDMIRAGEFRPPVQTSSPQPVPRDLRVDVPLLPCNDNSDNTLARTRILAPEDLAEAKELVASSDTLSGSDGPTGQLVTFFLEKATSVMRRAEQEKLQSLDATSRVPVPVLDFSVPAPEWDQRLWEPRAMFRWIQRDIDVDWKGPKWPHNRVAEQRMVWAPLAHMKEKTLVSERIAVDDETLRVFLQRSRDEEVLTSSDYVYKHPGLAILRMEDDEEEEDDDLAPLNLSTHTPTDVAQPNSLGRTPSLTEPDLALQGSSPVIATPPTQLLPDLPSLLSGRKTLIDKALETRWPSRKRERGTASTPEVSATEIIDSALIPSTNVLRGFMSEYTDFAPLVDNFVEMNFPKKQKLTHSPFFGRAGTTPATAQQRADEAAKLMPPPPKPIPALAPDVIPPRIPPRIVVFSTVSKPLTQALEKLLPDLELIPRAHDRHRPPGWRPGMRSPNLDEADIVVSPATGILLTTMVQLRQRPVPGCQPGNIAAAPTTTPMTTMSSFCQVVANVSARHERLVVLVSEGNKHSETASPLSQSDARALAEFQGFAAGLRTADVQVVYVAGGVETLAKWVAATICRHAGEAEAVRDLLLPVETLWEVFLRRAGMDVFAAQVVLGRLKMPEDRPAVGGGDGQVFGLPLFVMMSKERRIELFEGVFGGRRMLERVSEVIDEPWGQWAVDELDFALGTQPSLEKFYDAL